MALMSINRQFRDEFASVLYAHSTFKFELSQSLYDDFSDPMWLDNLPVADAGVEWLRVVLTMTMALYMVKCHVVVELAPEEEEQSGRVFEILNWFVDFLWTQRKKGPRLSKLKIECIGINGKLQQEYLFAFEPLVHL